MYIEIFSLKKKLLEKKKRFYFPQSNQQQQPQEIEQVYSVLKFNYVHIQCETQRIKYVC